ncbi:25275_t:CDS:1, partial [Racocetra persica]
KICSISELNIETSRSSSNLQNHKQHLLGNHSNLSEITNLEYHKPRGRPPKHYKSLTEEKNNQYIPLSSKTCSYCQEKEHNIRGYKKQKVDSLDKKNSEYKLN